MTSDWPTVVSEASNYLRGAKRLVLCWCAVFVIACLTVRNPYAVSFHQMDVAAIATYRVQLGLVATAFYCVPIMVVMVMHNLRDRIDELWNTMAGRELPPYAQAELGRVAFLGRVVAALAVVTACVVAALVAGAWWMVTVRTRVAGLVFAYVAIVLFALVFAIAAGGFVKLTRNSAGAMLGLMLLLTALYVGTPLLSDILLVREFGTMPPPASAEWFAYLEQTANSAGILIYAISPVELILLYGTMAFAVRNTMPLWQLMTAMAGFAAVAWAFMLLAGGWARRRAVS